MKIYKEYKEIDLKDIKGVRVNLYDEGVISKVDRAREMIKRKGIKNPFEAIEIGNEYKLIADRINFIAAKTLVYDKVPCLIRDTKQEILLRKLNKIFKLEDENYEIKSDINDEECLKSCRKNYYKLNIL